MAQASCCTRVVIFLLKAWAYIELSLCQTLDLQLLNKVFCVLRHFKMRHLLLKALIKMFNREMIIFSVTLFTFAKMSIFCGKRDLRIKLSPIWTMINFLLSSFQIFVLGYLVSHHLKHHPINPSDSKAVVSWMHYHVQDFYHAVIGLHLTSGRVNVVKTALVLTVWQKPVKTT